MIVISLTKKMVYTDNVNSHKSLTQANKSDRYSAIYIVVGR